MRQPTSTSNAPGEGLEPTLSRRQRFVFGVVALAAFAIGVLAALFRSTGVPKWDTVWAEDGKVFATCAWHEPFASCLLTPYQGYLHLVPRVVASIAVLFNPDHLPLLMTLAEGVAAGVAAALVGRALLGAGIHPLLALVGATGLVLVDQAGREIGGEIANVHLTLFAASAVILACQLLGRPLDWVDLVLVAVTGVTSAFSPGLPIIALGGVLFRARGAIRAFLVASIAAAPQLVVELINPRVDVGVPPPFDQLPMRFWEDVVENGFFGSDYPAWGVILFVVLVVSLVVLLVGAIRRSENDASSSARGSSSRTGWSGGSGARDRLDSPALRSFLAAGGLTLVAVAIFVLSVDINRVVDPRYAYVPTVLLVAALAIGLPAALAILLSGTQARRGGVPIGQVVVALAIGAAFATTFRLDARTAVGPDVVAELTHDAGTCTVGTDIEVPISPETWTMTVPCDRLKAHL